MFVLGERAVSLAEGIALASAGALLLLLLLLLMVSRSVHRQREDAALRGLLAQEVEERIGELARIQSEMTGRLQSVGELLAGRQAELAQAVGERLDGVTHKLGQTLDASAHRTVEGLRHLYERIAVIDNAQKNLSELTSQVTSLREVLANKQTRGAFGQARMEAIVRDGLPAGAYEFQFTLSNHLRPDCAVFLPDKRPLVIDAKFPLEAVTALREARTEEEKKRAAQRIRGDIGKHVADIARYLIPGETQDIALMFVPSESVYADLYDGFDDLVQKAYRARVVLVSPSLLMLAIQVVQQIGKDARMREAAGLIQTEVGHLMDDLGRLRDRVEKLERHFGQASEDIRQIIVSSDKVERRGRRIEELEFGEEGDDGDRVTGALGTAAREHSAVIIPAPLPRKLQAGE